MVTLITRLISAFYISILHTVINKVHVTLCCTLKQASKVGITQADHKRLLCTHAHAAWNVTLTSRHMSFCLRDRSFITLQHVSFTRFTRKRARGVSRWLDFHVIWCFPVNTWSRQVTHKRYGALHSRDWQESEITGLAQIRQYAITLQCFVNIRC